MALDTTSEETEEAVEVRGRIAERTRFGRRLPRRGQVKRYILTSAQNNTHVHEEAWLNLLALASHYGAEVLVGTFSYNKSAYGKKAIKRGASQDFDRTSWYDPHVLEHIVDDAVELAPGLVWCGELNIIPTSTDPLSMMESYNGRASNIVPHVKQHLTSIASLGDEATKFNFSTGTVTQRNYIEKKIGLLSERYHTYGGLLVEVCGDSSWYVRQLECAEDGSIRDLLLKAKDGAVTDGNPIEALVVGDVHVRVIDPMTRKVVWGKGGMVDELEPGVQVLHDLIDFRSRNHHEMKDPLAMYQKWQAEEEGVEDEVQECVDFVNMEASRSTTLTLVAPSNHHEAMLRWLKDSDWRSDPINARFYLQAWLAVLDGEEDVFAWSCRRAGVDPTVQFLPTDSSFVVAKATGGGIELAMHGHLGINGARGNARNFTKLGRRVIHGHEHHSGIRLGVMTVGTASRMRIGYNKGPSSWSSTHAIVYPEGTATLVTVWKGRWRA
jgi:hypothetical protein